MPWQLDLYESNAEHIERVSDKIAQFILDFFDDRVRMRRDIFHMQELLNYVQARVKVAPDSPGRILRDLRSRGLVRYLVLSRKHSRYMVVR